MPERGVSVCKLEAVSTVYSSQSCMGRGHGCGFGSNIDANPELQNFAVILLL